MHQHKLKIHVRGAKAGNVNTIKRTIGRLEFIDSVTEQHAGVLEVCYHSTDYAYERIANTVRNIGYEIERLDN